MRRASRSTIAAVMPKTRGAMRMTRGWCRAWRRALSVIFVAGALVAIGVRAQAASLTFAWTAPVTNADGTPLTDLSSYRLYLATSGQGCPGSSYVAIATPTPAPRSGDALSVRLASLTAGVTYFGAVTAVDAAGLESDCT